MIFWAIMLSAFYVGVFFGVFVCALGAASKRGDPNARQLR